VNELRRLFAKPYAHAVDKNELCAAVADCLTNLFARKRLQLFGLAANQDNRLRVTNVAMRREWTAEICEEGV
jgi:hypothetical protein